MEFPKIAAYLHQASAYPAVLATLVSVEGSSYRRVGARLGIFADGAHFGSISGGCLEEDLITRARALIKSEQRHELVSYDTTGENDLIWGVGTGCHGIVKVLLEVLTEPPSWRDEVIAVASDRRPVSVETIWEHPSTAAPLGTRHSASAPDQPDQPGTVRQHLLPPWHLVVFGAGDDASPLVELASAMQWEVTVVDPRQHKATPERFPHAKTVLARPCLEAIQTLAWDDRTVAVVMTHHYVHDLPLLQGLLPLHLKFLGLLGPRQRGERLLRDAGFSAEDPAVRFLHSPVGLDLGGDGPEAVALSIMAEIQSTLHDRDARPLRQRTRSIHRDD